MSMVKHLILLTAFLTMPLCARANHNDLAVAIASNHIDITVGFDGSTIELFGDRRDKDTNVAIVVEGPKKDVTIWQKAKVMGTWVNRYYVKFTDMPIYYSYAISTDEVDEHLQNVMLENGIGHEALFKKIKHKSSKKLKNDRNFYNEFVRKSSELGVFFEEPVKLEFINNNFFRASFKVPASAPTGEYKIHSYLIKGNKISDYKLDSLVVKQVGLNAFINNSAYNYSLIYAAVCIFLALFSGWFVSVLRVKT